MILTSYLQNVFYSKAQEKHLLHQSQITSQTDHADWPTFIEGFLADCTYPTPPAHKAETYGWTPTIFNIGPNRDGIEGHWRYAPLAFEYLTLFVADLDNNHETNAKVSIDQVQAYLNESGLNHLLYTSFSHTDTKHKVRIVIPIDQPITTDEAFDIFNVFNADLNHQLDGSIYDPADFIYGPSVLSEVRHTDQLASLNVKAYLDRSAVQPTSQKLVRKADNHGHELTCEDLAKIKLLATSMDRTEEADIFNPNFFNPAWFDLLRSKYMGGSNSRTVRGLLAKAFVKSNRSLTKADLWVMFMQLDQEIGGYCLRTYGRAACDRDILSAMTAN